MCIQHLSQPTFSCPKNWSRNLCFHLEGCYLCPLELAFEKKPFILAEAPCTKLKIEATFSLVMRSSKSLTSKYALNFGIYFQIGSTITMGEYDDYSISTRIACSDLSERSHNLAPPFTESRKAFGIVFPGRKHNENGIKTLLGAFRLFGLAHDGSLDCGFAGS